MKIALVITRCGPDIFAGAEKLVFDLGKRLSEIFEVEILTTCAKDAATWKNHYKKGTTMYDKLKITRFPVDNERDSNYVALSRYLEKNNSDLSKGLEFVNCMGPVCNSFLTYIKKNYEKYDFFIFFGYLYWLSFFGLPLVKEKSIFFPQAHDEPWACFKIYDQVFENASSFLFQTRSEKSFVEKRFGTDSKISMIVGHGVELPSHKSKNKLRKLPENYVLYIGRINEGKGCQLLSDYFNRYSDIHDTDLKLIILGDEEQKILNSCAIVFENLSEEEKHILIGNCRVFIMPSYFESLNVSCLESMLHKKPILVNGKCDVLKEHCLIGQSGLYFTNYEEFSESLDLLLEDQNFSIKLGQNGENYVKENYNWDSTKKKYRDFLNMLINKDN